MMGLSSGEKILTVCLAVLIQLQTVMDGWTNTAFSHECRQMIKTLV